MVIKTCDFHQFRSFFKRINFPKSFSHKGENGRLLIIGGSLLFHAASLWSAAIASRIVDIVHYSSTKENQKIFINLKSKFVDGIVIKKENLLEYVEEDDCILLGPGMLRGKVENKFKKELKWERILKIKDEASYTYFLTRYLTKNFPQKKFVFDAGSLQMMEKEWLCDLSEKPILTPHQEEFRLMFGIDLAKMNFQQKKEIVKKTAQNFNCILLVKAVDDFISDGKETVVIQGGNPGLTKGGTGDVLAGLVAGLNTKNDQLVSAVVASFILKKSAEELAKEKGLWYNATDLVFQIPKTLKESYDKILKS